MERIEHLPNLRARLAEWRAAGERIALVPTMGNLHQGHLTLVRAAAERADRVVASIFVNPLQFGPGEDLDAYPRTPEADRDKLAAGGCDLLFAPAVETIYPNGQTGQTRVEVPGISALFCGASRPGHFVGVATIVCKLFNMVQPDVAVFGEKDFQQLLVIRRMVEDLSIPVAIHGVETVREPDGLARSSRNAYLTAAERERAPALNRVLDEAAAAVRAGRPFVELELAACRALEAEGFAPEYFKVCRAADLAPPESDERDLVILAAARLGRARLIDNRRVRR
ncbi:MULTISPECIES: pantoate--beta-alanine ligase [Marichromatium]|uniref:Pantothenate synthetase n=1 Tax=Marichromatium gracile TaxID=1048 RepID=A0A4R4AE31_MARGR|nr:MULTISPECIES: pantoate--beta-alanine ligase [Marichromatium]MBO8085541.1 pantoate--beta-alanine ligase [Marichromatium sp.]MBK1709433.1 pantoate--beta-alanine ligase [Marichromatium gracile]RNE91549.1 pantoate--beta-alanine ligase [Marichromatium sp. AB31]RNE93910.1 pantoate--beta-alanine ligase [Marichromatium sp. AB32]TCW36979.1 pantothenate synthetase [Marichromatium gracile]